MEGEILRLGKIAVPVMLLFLAFGLASVAQAEDVTWNGLGSDNLASNPINWTSAIPPQDNDSIIFDNTSSKDCSWDAYVIPFSLSLNSGYTGTTTMNSELMIIDNVAVSGGTLIIVNGLMIGGMMSTMPPYPPSSLSATDVSSTQLDLSWDDNSNLEDGFRIERKTGAEGSYSQIDTVASNITTYVDVGLSSDTTYYYRVKAYNASGDSDYSNEATSTTSPYSTIALTITSPPNDATISGYEVMVKGTITDAEGYETGVTVNGIVPSLYDNQFVAGHVPLVSGTNILTVTANDTGGNSASAYITVNAVTTGNYIRLAADTESGLVPLETTLRIDGSFSIDNSTITVTGPAQPEFLSSSATEYKVRMTVEGIYYFTATVTGPDNKQYQDTVAVVVMSRTAIDNLLKGIWEEMKASLSAQDIEAALNYFTADSRLLYSDIFTTLSAQLPQLVQDMQDIQLIYIKDGGAKYRIRKDELYGGQTLTITYYVYFAIDENGTWKIERF